MPEGIVCEALALDVHDFGRELAFQTAMLRPTTKHKGLSLADRACLALGGQLGLPVLTTDRAWTELELGVEVRLIRP